MSYKYYLYDTGQFVTLYKVSEHNKAAEYNENIWWNTNNLWTPADADVCKEINEEEAFLWILNHCG